MGRLKIVDWIDSVGAGSKSVLCTKKYSSFGRFMSVVCVAKPLQNVSRCPTPTHFRILIYGLNSYFFYIKLYFVMIYLKATVCLAFVKADPRSQCSQVFENEELTTIVLCDLSKVLEIVSVDILFNKLSFHGVRPKIKKKFSPILFIDNSIHWLKVTRQTLVWFLLVVLRAPYSGHFSFLFILMTFSVISIMKLLFTHIILPLCTNRKLICNKFWRLFLSGSLL